MKKVLKFLLICCLIVPCALLVTACKNEDDGPYSVAGKTFQGSAVCMVKWNAGLTEAEKQAIMADTGTTNEEEFCQIMSDDIGGETLANVTFSYNSDGTMTINHNGQVATSWYTQSSDLKSILHYTDEGKTNLWEEEFRGLEYYNDKYCLMFESTDYILYFIFNEV